MNRGSPGASRRSTGSSATLARSAASVTAAAMALNLLGYLTSAIGARWLEEAEFGGFATILALLAIGVMPAIGLQTAIAVRQARGELGEPRRTALLTALGAGGLLTAGIPLTSWALELPAGPLLWAAAALVPMILAGLPLGVLQGAERFHALATAITVMGLARFGGLLAGLGLTRDLTGALATSAVACWLGYVVVAWLAGVLGPLPAFLRRPPRTAPDGALPIRAVVTASNALLAMLALANADLLLARNLLPEAESGRYAVGALLTKGVLWAPGAIIVLVLPRLARGGARALALALVAVGGSGLVLVGLAAGFSRTAVWLVGGDRYLDLAPEAWLFATLGALLAIVHLLLNARLAESRHWLALPVWGAVAGLAVLVYAWPPYSLHRIVLLAIAVATVTAAGLTLRQVTQRCANRNARNRPYPTVWDGQASAERI